MREGSLPQPRRLQRRSRAVARWCAAAGLPEFPRSSLCPGRLRLRTDEIVASQLVWRIRGATVAMRDPECSGFGAPGRKSFSADYTDKRGLFLERSRLLGCLRGTSADKKNGVKTFHRRGAEMTQRR